MQRIDHTMILIHTATLLPGDSVGLCNPVAPLDDLTFDALTFTYWVIKKAKNIDLHTTACRDATEKFPTLVSVILVVFDTPESNGYVGKVNYF